MPDIRASVAICTRNRARILARGLSALCEMQVPAGTQWELVLVDNASTDETPAVIASFQGRLPMRAFVESAPGISPGRNRAVAEARGDYILWIDDDAVAEQGWLAAYLEAFDRWPEAALLGGPINVEFDAPLPEWFRRVLPRIAPVFGYRDLGAEPLLLPPRENMLPFGTNYVTRTADQRRFRYDTSLGRHPNHPGRGSEETDLMLTMLQSGLIGRWVPGARVTHLKGLDRVNTEFLASHWTAYGEYRALRRPSPGRRVAGAPLHAWWRAARAAARYEVTRRFSEPEQWIEDLIERSEAFGALKGLRSRRR